MLTECFERIGENRLVKSLRAFFHSVFYPALIVLLMVCANLFSLELPVFYLYLAFGLLLVLFDDDLKGIVPIALCCYMTISYENNPAFFPPGGEGRVSAFYDPAFALQLVFLLSASATLIAGRLVSVLMRGEKKKAPALAIGFGALGLSLVLGGLFTRYYDFRTALFGFTVTASLCALYFLFYYGVDWKKTKKTDWAVLFCAIGCGLLFELLGMYVKSGMLKNPQMDRGALQTGWGMYNNVGCVLAMCIPATLYLAAKCRYGWAFTVLGCVQAAGLLFTQSRSSILFGGAAVLVALAILLIKCEKGTRKFHLATLGAALLIAIVAVAFMWEKFTGLFKSMIDMTFGDDPSNARGPIYAEGWRHFLSAPFFGVGFYRCTAFQWGELPGGAFLPPRYHNTVIQLMASGGVFALGCYLLHRLETAVLFFRKPSLCKTFIALSVLPLLLTSLVECHMFSFGPGMLYSVLLVFAEGEEFGR